MNIAMKQKGRVDAVSRHLPEVAELANWFGTCTEIDKALGFSQGLYASYLRGKNHPSSEMRKRMQNLLDSLSGGANSDPAPCSMNKAEEISKPTPATAPDSGHVLMVVCPAGKLEKVQKVLGLLGCEVEEI